LETISFFLIYNRAGFTCIIYYLVIVSKQKKNKEN
jgi:hypothetical protein